MSGPSSDRLCGNTIHRKAPTPRAAPAPQPHHKTRKALKGQQQPAPNLYPMTMCIANLIVPVRSLASGFEAVPVHMWCKHLDIVAIAVTIEG